MNSDPPMASFSRGRRNDAQGEPQPREDATAWQPGSLETVKQLGCWACGGAVGGGAAAGGAGGSGGGGAAAAGGGAGGAAVAGGAGGGADGGGADGGAGGGADGAAAGGAGGGAGGGAAAGAAGGAAGGADGGAARQAGSHDPRSTHAERVSLIVSEGGGLQGLGSCGGYLDSRNNRENILVVSSVAGLQFLHFRKNHRNPLHV